MSDNINTSEKIIPKTMPGFLSRLPLWWLGIMAFAFPLFVLPPFWQNLHLNKSIFLFGGVLIGYIFWWISQMKQRKFVFKFAFQDFLIIIFLVFYGISAFLGGQNSYALFNFSQTPWALSILIVLALLYFLVRNILNSEKDILFLLKNVVIGGLIAVILNVLVYLKVLKLPTNFLGQLSSTGIFAAFLCILSLEISHFTKRNFSKIIFALSSIVFFVAMLLIDFNICWYVFLAIGLAYLIIKFWKFKISNLEFNLLLLFLVIAAAFLFLSSPQIFRVYLPSEISLSQQGSWHVIYPVVKEHPLFGTGFNSFVNNFSKFRSSALNNTVAWNIRFRQPSSTFFAMLNNAGLVGIFLLFLIFFSVVKKAIADIRREGNALTATIGASSLVLIATAFFYNFPLFLTFFAVIILGILELKMGHKIEVKFDESQKGRLLTNAFVVVSLLLTFIVGYFVLRVYLGEVYYAKAISITNTKNLQKIDSFEKSIRQAIYWDPYQKNYYTTYIAVMFNAATIEAKKANPDKAKYQKWISQAVNNGVIITKKYSHDAGLLSKMGDIYSQLIFSVNGADKFAIDSYKKAIVLDPTNPVLYTNLGSAQLQKITLIKSQLKGGQNNFSHQALQGQANQVDKESQKLLKEAISNFQKSIQLKIDYLPAHYNLAKAYEIEGKFDLALKELDSALAIDNRNVNVIFAKGRIFLGQNKLPQAQKEFEKAISIFPNHSNSLYSLGVTLSKEGKYKEALTNFEKVLKLNPGNKDVEDKINSLRKKLGLKALNFNKTSAEKPLKEGYVVRNNQRKVVLQEIINALDKYAKKQGGNYPKSVLAYLDNPSSMVMKKLIAEGFASTVFKDPQSKQHHFVYKSDGQKYEIDYVQENPNGGFSDKKYQSK